MPNALSEKSSQASRLLASTSWSRRGSHARETPGLEIEAPDLAMGDAVALGRFAEQSGSK
jgi:hypothetical protein